MKKRKVDIKNVWVYIFLLFMLLLPLQMIAKSLLLTIIIFTLVIFLCFRFNIPKFPLLLFIFTFITRLVVVFVVDTPPVSDFSILYDASQGIINKDYSFLNSSYFQTWSYQIGFVWVQSLLLRIVNSVTFLQIINCLLSTLTTMLIYLISKEFVSEKSSKVSSVIYAFLPFTLTYVTVLTNQHLSSLLICLSLYVIISNKIKLSDTKKYIISAILLAIANVIRPESIIPLFSIVLFLLLTMNKINFKKNLKNILVTVGTYFCLTLLISSVFQITGLAPEGLKNNDPYWKFVCGFNYESGGRYAAEHVGTIGNFVAEKEIIKKQILVSPLKLTKLFLNKIDVFWLRTTLDWSFHHFYGKYIILPFGSIYINNLVNLLSMINNYMMNILYILMIIGVYKYIKKKNYNKNILLLINQVFVTFGVYLLIEVQPRYLYYIQIIVTILASFGIEEILNYLKGKKVKIK